MVKRSASTPSIQAEGQGGLAHVLVCGGTTREWSDSSVDEWKSQLDTLVDSVHESGARWMTLCPYSGDAGLEEKIGAAVLQACGGQRVGNRISFIAQDGLVVVVDMCADGRERFAKSVASLKTKNVDEEKLRVAMLPPGFSDPDLILIFGSPTRIPPSLMWELSYSELVFLDVSWRKCNVEHVQMAIDDFQRRDRRFGGVDS